MVGTQLLQGVIAVIGYADAVMMYLCKEKV